MGYSQNTANASGNTMMAPTFLSVSSETGCTLADLSVTGYEAPVYDDEEEEYTGGCAGGEFILSILTSSGTYESRYYWIDDGETTAGWYANGLGGAIPGGASSVQLLAGQGVWVLGRGMKLQCAGAVNENDVAKKTNSSGNTAMGNCMPIDLTLARLTVSGYSAPVYDDEEEEYTGGCAGGEFILSYLTPNGTYAARYYWIDDGETGPGWYANGLGGAIDGGATSVALPAGQGVWVLGRGMYLNFPAPEL